MRKWLAVRRSRRCPHPIGLRGPLGTQDGTRGAADPQASGRAAASDACEACVPAAEDRATLSSRDMHQSRFPGVNAHNQVRCRDRGPKLPLLGMQRPTMIGDSFRRRVIRPCSPIVGGAVGLAVCSSWIAEIDCAAGGYMIRRAVLPGRTGLPDLTAVSWSGRRARPPDLPLRLL